MTTKRGCFQLSIFAYCAFTQTFARRGPVRLDVDLSLNLSLLITDYFVAVFNMHLTMLEHIIA